MACGPSPLLLRSLRPKDMKSFAHDQNIYQCRAGQDTRSSLCLFYVTMQLTIQVVSTTASGVYFSSNILNTEFDTCATPTQGNRRSQILLGKGKERIFLVEVSQQDSSCLTCRSSLVGCCCFSSSWAIRLLRWEMLQENWVMAPLILLQMAKSSSSRRARRRYSCSFKE